MHKPHEESYPQQSGWSRQYLRNIWKQHRISTHPAFFSVVSPTINKNGGNEKIINAFLLAVRKWPFSTILSGIWLQKKDTKPELRIKLTFFCIYICVVSSLFIGYPSYVKLFFIIESYYMLLLAFYLCYRPW